MFTHSHVVTVAWLNADDFNFKTSKFVERCRLCTVPDPLLAEMVASYKILVSLEGKLESKNGYM